MSKCKAQLSQRSVGPLQNILPISYNNFGNAYLVYFLYPFYDSRILISFANISRVPTAHPACLLSDRSSVNKPFDNSRQHILLVLQLLHLLLFTFSVHRYYTEHHACNP